MIDDCIKSNKLDRPSFPAGRFEAGRLKATLYHLGDSKDLASLDGDEDKTGWCGLVHIMGTSFGKKYGKKFSVGDVSMAHNLVFHNMATTIVIQLKYRYQIIDRYGVKHQMEALVGYRLLPTAMRIVHIENGQKKKRARQGQHDFVPKLKPATLIQFCICNKYKGLNFGGIMTNNVSIPFISTVLASLFFVSHFTTLLCPLDARKALDSTHQHQCPLLGG